MPIYALDEKATGRLLADIILESSRSVEVAQQMAAASQEKHLTGAVLATYTILDLCQVTDPHINARATLLASLCSERGNAHSSLWRKRP
jgi:hypothetical protein